MHVLQVQQSHAQRCQEPTCPQSPAIAACDAGEDSNDHGGGRDGECFGEEGDTCDDGREALNALEVDGAVVEE